MEQYSGTQPVQDRQRFDIGALDAWVMRTKPGPKIETVQAEQGGSHGGCA